MAVWKCTAYGHFVNVVNHRFKKESFHDGTVTMDLDTVPLQ